MFTTYVKHERGMWTMGYEERKVYYEVWSKIEKVLYQWEQTFRKTTAGAMAMTAE